ncbi:MAG: hypothetical protein JXB26_01780 [Candidatus Aminicenantes bacterium]|nr:hypothetical protein [Candidatus Aminicenantes bacterium]
MGIKIKEIDSKRDLKKFISFPFSLYKKSRYWIAPLVQNELNTLREDKNPAFEYCEAKYWIAYKEGEPAGRIAGIINHKFIKKWKIPFANFSRFDFINDRSVSAALLSQVEEWASEKGLEGIHGPLGFTNFDQQGMLVKGFDELPTLASVYNYDYYPEHMEANEWEKEIEYVEYEVKTPDHIPEKAKRLSDIVLKRYGLNLFKASSKKKLLPFAGQIFEVINKSYKDIFYAVDLSAEQIEMYKNKYLSFIRPEFVSLVIDSEERVIGFQISMPSLSKAFQKARGRLFPLGFFHILKALRFPKNLDLYLVGIIPQYQNKGINAVFMTDLTKTALKYGIDSVETNSELETNTKVRAFWNYYEARMHKRKRVYKRKFAL